MDEQKEQRAISRELEYLARDISVVTAVATELGEQLAPLLAPSVPKEKVNNISMEQEEQCPFSSAIASQRHRLQDVTTKLQDFRSRLQV